MFVTILGLSVIIIIIIIPSQALYTRSKVLGDRSMLFKFLSPNLLFVATAAPPAPSFAAMGERDASLEARSGPLVTVTPYYNNPIPQ